MSESLRRHVRIHARCTVIAHAAHCSCELGYEGDAFVGCSKIEEKPKDRIDPCYPSPCGENALCSERNGEARCIVLNHTS
ncbi:unnamed protein product [Ceratitis capitata]|uniref:(Mediterranean fruit fly) hypothetical protein n=1 Tax=Ceratitis capitata TaxID=7213 RepID=A0A811UPA6_CERCA|nr:unnamed protein product [Ceratitis capitata]